MATSEQKPAELPSLQTVTRQALMREASRPAIEYDGTWTTWGEIRDVAERLSGLLNASGLPPGAPVALITRNRPSGVAVLLGLLAKGCTVQMVYAFQSASAKARELERLRPGALVAADEEFSDEVRAMLRTQGIAGIAITGMELSSVPGLERARRDIEVPAEPQIQVLTSGTTGPPKQFSVSYELIATHHLGVDLMRASQGVDPLEMPPMLLYFPLGNITGIYSTLPCVLRGQRTILLDRFSVVAWHDYVLRYKPAMTGLPPAGVQMVLDANIAKEDLACIRYLGTGAAPLDPTAHRAFEERYGIPILLSYGATEFAGPVASMTPELYAQWGQQKFGSVGRAMPGAQLRVIDPGTLEPLPPGQEGILEVVSPRIGPQWIRTADVARIDADGFMFHLGRADGAIMRGGFKVLPETIERALVLHPAVSSAAVVGIADHRLGQVPAALVQLKPGVAQPTVEELEAHLRAHVLATHVPVKWRFTEDLPRNPSMKTDRPAVRRLMEN